MVNATAVPTHYALMQNAPNPFNAGTQIPYALKDGGQVRLEVYNLLGQRVATLVDGYQAAGYHVATWDANTVASGVYLYRLQTNTYTATKKMVLMK